MTGEGLPKIIKLYVGSKNSWLKLLWRYSLKLPALEYNTMHECLSCIVIGLQFLVRYRIQCIEDVCFYSKQTLLLRQYSPIHYKVMLLWNFAFKQYFQEISPLPYYYACAVKCRILFHGNRIVRKSTFFFTIVPTYQP